MKFEIDWVCYYFEDVEWGIWVLNWDVCWLVWIVLMLYKGILDVIEVNNYNVFNCCVYVFILKKLLYLFVVWLWV